MISSITDYIIEREPLVNTFISVPKDKGMSDFQYNLWLRYMQEYLSLAEFTSNFPLSRSSSGTIL